MRSRRQRIYGAAAAFATLLALIVVVVASAGDDPAGETGSTTAAQAPQRSRLQRSRETRGVQQATVREVLDYTSFLRAGTPGERRVALTFDDGPGPQTAEVLNILRRHDAPATFFISGNMLASFHDLTRRELREGHAIGTHGFDHPRMGSLDPAEQARQIERVGSQLHAYGLPVPELFRPPYGSFDTTTLELLARDRALMVLWSVDTGDYLQPGSEVIAERALAGAEPGAVILLHDAGGDRSQTIEALPEILAGLRKRGLEPATVPELLASNPPPSDQSIEEAAAVKPPGTAVSAPGSG